jgi:hypothetical protein
VDGVGVCQPHDCLGSSKNAVSRHPPFQYGVHDVLRKITMSMLGSDRKRLRGSRRATFSHSLHETPTNLARRLIPAMDARRWLDANAETVSAPVFARHPDCSISSFEATACDAGPAKDLLGAAETT